jgi:hypothetical protein
MSAQLLEVLFNHDPTDKRGSALNLRVNSSVTSSVPEWQGGARHPVAYATRVIMPSLLVVGARLRWTGPPCSAVEVRALSSPVSTDLRAPIMGELVARLVPLGANGVSERVLFHVRGGWVMSAPVGTYRIAWRWQVRARSADPWADFALTEHDIYATLTLPASPWTELPFVAANIALPWSDVLAIACKWAAGARNASEAALLITSRLFSLGPELFEYGCAVFGREMYANSVLAVFDCSAFVERINGGEGNGRYVNCTDCACIISTLANVLGLRLWQSRMGTYVPTFKTRDIRTIGGTRWTSPCGLGLGFMFHEVAWSGNATEHDTVYDGSLLVNANLSSSGLIVPMLPAGLGFGRAFGGRYRSMLAQQQDQLICHPAPEERRCRALM